jgi:PAS domain S-box-containing protein
MDTAGSKLILLVEDEPLVALAQQEYLQDAGYRVKLARTGEDAVRIVHRSEDIDLILMDIDLGVGIDGTEAAVQALLIRTLPIVFLSSHTEPEIVERIQSITSYGYVVKGTGPVVMIAAVRMAFQLWDAHTKVEQANAEKQKQNEYMRQILSLDPTSYIALDKRGIVQDVNEAYCRLTGYWPQELIGRHISELDAYDDQLHAMTRIGGMLEGGKHRFSTSHRCKGGGNVDIDITVQRIETVDGTRLIAFCNDLTEERRMTDELIDDGGSHTSQDGMRHYLESELYQLVRTDPAIFTFLREGSLDGLWYWDLENQDQEWMDNRFWELFGFDPKEKTHSPSEWQDLIHPEDLKVALENFKKHLADPSYPYDQIVRYSHKDGSTVYVRCRGMAVRDADGVPLRMLGVHNDLTRLMKTLENERLLRTELNHRVKNNLAIVHSLLSLKEMKSSGTVDLSDIKHQVETIRLVHETLQNSDGLDRVEVCGYLRSILSSVFDDQTRVQVSGNELMVSTKVAVTLGLIVNELATNAMKHGFVPELAREFGVSIESCKMDPGLARINVQNSGRPFPEEVDPATATSLGMQLIQSLVGELNSDLRIARHPSASFEFDVHLDSVTDLA